MIVSVGSFRTLFHGKGWVAVGSCAACAAKSTPDERVRGYVFTSDPGLNWDGCGRVEAVFVLPCLAVRG